MGSFRLNDAALADLDRIYEYGILNFGLRQADKYYDGLLLYLRIIADSPLSHIGVSEIRTGYRRATYHSNSILLPNGKRGRRDCANTWPARSEKRVAPMNTPVIKLMPCGKDLVDTD